MIWSLISFRLVVRFQISLFYHLFFNEKQGEMNYKGQTLLYITIIKMFAFKTVSSRRGDAVQRSRFNAQTQI